MNVPFDYDAVNYYNGKISVAGTVVNDELTRYFARGLYQRAIAGTKIITPRTWIRGKRYLRNVLFSEGYIGVIRSPKYGIIPQICSFNGMGIFLEPKNMIVSQPLVQFEGEIGRDCELIHLTGDYRGIWDIVMHHAIRLAVATTSLDCALINERISFLAAAKNKQSAETLKALYERISAGEPFAVVDKYIKDESLDGNSDPIWSYSQDVASQYISDKLLADIDKLIEQFDKEIGIAAVGEKKERMLDSEIEMQNEDNCARVSTWFENLTESFDLVNQTFPELNLSFTMTYGGETHEYNTENDASRDV